ncbi:G patch domain-containing protein 4 isoform X2 [Siniperca chuatsi]|nr:G patch domain-containing protein 4 isoform X2 [Siniperca chuatsi]XP_044064181.1 G patch domain-containing protein 4 isoform X2 [Siniperca chuatsi]XP_044064183.1 G patch domain-containing protein 4 isoform X2 [Siniperca chuatsi]XP_044064184.1 G patch domain-containing protein 4 isoform X2 [Siniperca chuatsi]
MAEVVQEKSRGLKFAEQQLLRHGWEHGKGLGRAENGISEAIKVKVKCDKGGVGHKEGEQFTFHWWDHVFNKASSSLQVESDQNGIQLKKRVEEDEEDGMISNKKPRKATLAKAKLYGCFVKSATLLSGQEQPEPKSSSSDDSSSSDEEEDQKLDLSSTIKLSDADIMKACGGRTAHKGARHGLTMSAKLARLEQQEAVFMAKYGKKRKPASASPVCVTPTPQIYQSADQRAERQEQTAEDSQRKKMKKKRSTGSVNELNGDEVSESPETDVKPKKKKKKKKASEDTEEKTDAISTEGDVICVENGEGDHSHKTKRKHKKKKNNAEQNEERAPSPAAQSKSLEETAEMHSVTKAKKKKSSKRHSEPAEEEESNDTESSQSEPVQDCVPKNKKKKAAVTLDEAEVTEENSTVKQKRKKCKKDKTSIDDNRNEEAPAPKKKKKKSKE